MQSFCWSQQAPLTRRFAPYSAPLLDPKGLVPPVDRMSLRDSCRGGQLGSRVPSFESMACACACPSAAASWACTHHLAAVPRALARPLVVVSQLYAGARLAVAVVRWHSPFRGGASSMFLAFSSGPSCMHLSGLSSPSVGISCGSASTSCLATRCGQDASASDFAAVALSASPAGSTLAVSSARAGAAPTTGTPPIVHACLCSKTRHPPRAHSPSWPCQQVRKGSMFSGNADELSGTDGIPSASCI
jgi:hypothetical protein